MRKEMGFQAVFLPGKSAESIRRLAVSFLLVFLLVCSGKQVFAFTIDEFIDGNAQRLFTSSDGLEATATNAIAQTTDGFIWIGGYGGLVRYDGREFEPFESGTISGIMDMLAASDGALYVGTADKGLFRYLDGVWENLSAGDESLMSIQSLAEDGEGTIWFGTSDGAGCLTPDGTIQHIGIPELEEQLIQRILCLPDGKKIFIVRTGELYVYDETGCERKSFGRNDLEIRCASYDPFSRKIYIGTTGNQLICCNLDFSGKIIYVTSGLQCINDVLVCPNDVVWLCADNGVSYFRKGHMRIQKLMINNSIDHGLVDEEGNFWFTSSRQGVLEVSESRFTDLSKSANLDSVIVNALYELDDKLYVGTDEGVIILNPHTCRVIEDPHLERLRGERIRDIKADPEGNLWFATRHQGLLCYRRNHEWVEYNMARFPALESDSFRCICFCPDGTILCGTDKGAYSVSGETITSALNESELMRKRILSVECRGDSCYLGTDGYGLYQVKDGEIVSRYIKEDGLSSDVIMKIVPGRYRDGYWLVTGDKIHFLSESGELYTAENLNTVNNLDLIVQDDFDVWLLTGSGIFHTTEKALLEETDPALVVYSHEEGLCYEVTANASHFVHGDLLYICGSGGVSSLNLQDRFLENESLRLNVDSVHADGKVMQVKEGEVVRIPPDVQRIDIKAHVLTYGFANPNVFYYLEGFDTERTVLPFEDLKQITYTNLNGGEYQFHFGIVDKETGDVLLESVVSFLKENKWHEDKRVQAFFLFLLLLLLSVIIWMIALWRARSVHRQELKELERQEQLRLREAAYNDYLTGLYNRNYLDVWQEKILPQAGYPITFVTVDCNNLKKINDTYGHKQGDQLLQTMAYLLRKHFAGDRFTVIRLGGDEFLVLCCRTGKDEAEQIVRHLTEDAETHRIGEMPVSFCAGICTQESGGTFDFDEGLSISDMEMLKEKALYHGRRK